MDNKHNAGFSLIEVLVDLVNLAAIVVPTCSSLVISHRMNAKTEQLMQAQLDVSSAVETLMAEGIEVEEKAAGVYIPVMNTERFSNVLISYIVKDPSASKEVPYFEVEVSSKIDDSVTVTTFIHINNEENS